MKQLKKESKNEKLKKHFKTQGLKRGAYVLLKKDKFKKEYQNNLLSRMFILSQIKTNNVLRGKWVDNSGCWFDNNIFKLTDIERIVPKEEAEQLIVENEI